MKKTLVISAMLLGLGAGHVLIPVATVQAAQTTPAATKTHQDWLGKLNTKVDLAQARVEALRAQIALEIDKAPERAKQALANAESRLLKAKDKASAEVAGRIEALQKDARAARDAVTAAPADARKKVNALVENTEKHLQGYGETALDTDEAKLLKKRYAQLQAHAALMKAQLAEKADKTGEQAKSYLDQAKAFYMEAKANASKKWHGTLNAISDRIDAAKEGIKTKRDRAGDAISKLRNRAADLVKGNEAAEPAE